jgi:hypothetical protein
MDCLDAGLGAGLLEFLSRARGVGLEGAMWLMWAM